MGQLQSTVLTIAFAFAYSCHSEQRRPPDPILNSSDAWRTYRIHSPGMPRHRLPSIGSCERSEANTPGLARRVCGEQLSRGRRVTEIGSIQYNADERAHISFISVSLLGHALPLLRMAEELKRRGYRVTFATNTPAQELVRAAGIEFISAGDFPIPSDELRLKLKKITHDASIFRGILAIFNEVYLPAAQPMYQTLLRWYTNDRPDLIVMDIGTVGALDLVHKLDIPFMINSPTLLFDLEGFPPYVPAWGTGFPVSMSLWNRCMNILFPRLLSVALTPPFMHVSKVRWELQLAPYRSQHEVFRGSRILLNTGFGLEHPRPVSPLLDVVGPILPTSYASAFEPVVPDVDNWLQTDGGVGIIFVSFGSMTYFDAWQAKTLVQGLTMGEDDPDLKVLMVLGNDQRNALPAALPASFRLHTTWSVPYLDILSHAAVKVVVSHCGMGSAQEALFFGKPVLCLPFFADQPDVAARIVDAGAGLMLDKTRLEPDEIREMVLSLYHKRHYRNAAWNMSKILRNSGGLMQAADIVEYTMRVGSTHLQTSDLQLPWHKSIMLDVMAVHSAVLSLFVVACWFGWLALRILIQKMWRTLMPKLPALPQANNFNQGQER